MSNDRTRYRRHSRLERVKPYSRWAATLDRIVDRLQGTERVRNISNVGANGLVSSGHGLAVGDGPFRFTAVSGRVAEFYDTTTDYWVFSVFNTANFRLSARESPLILVSHSTGAGTGTLVRRVDNEALRSAMRRTSFETVYKTDDIDDV